ncbi:MAG: hypothetical protein AB7D36_02875 [Oscillospiraceae bacterium]
MTNLYKYLWLICGCIGLYGAYTYFMHKEGILLVAVSFIACIVFRLLYVKSRLKDQEKRK